MAQPPLGTEIRDAPTDGVSGLAFGRVSRHLLAASSWDKSVTIIDTTVNAAVARYKHDAAVLDVDFSTTEDVVYSGGLDRCVRRFDVSSQIDRTLGSHDDAVRCVEYCAEQRQVVTGSWDKTLRLWDDRTSTQTATKTLDHPDRIYSISTCPTKIVVALSNRMMFIYDARNLDEPVQKRESSLKFMTRSVCCLYACNAFASSSTEGRVAVEYFDSDERVQAKNYSFKCHRQAVDGADTVYPVNALAYHPIYGTFASGGGDGVVNVWDGFNKKRLKQYPRYPTSISALCFSADGSMLAVASSYTFEEGEKDHPPDSIYIRSIAESEVKPKTVTQKA